MAKHSIVHVEFSAQDPKAAGEFYRRLFGWKIEASQVGDAFEYVQFTPEEAPAGGFNQVGQNASAGEVLVYVSSDDIEASLAKAEKLGGKSVVPKTEIPGIGWFGVFTDPTGNKVGLYTAQSPQ
jgi:predicted enzyme related to lactoylglutathione lyase